MKTVRCGCQYVDEFDYSPITEEGCEVGDVYAACAGHMHLTKIRTILGTHKEPTMKDPLSKTYKEGNYGGDPQQELLDRLRRFETRVTKFMRWNGFNPTSDPAVEASSTCHVAGGDVHCDNPHVTLGQISSVANKAQLNGAVQVFVAGKLRGVVQV